MPQHQPLSRLATAISSLALAFAATYLHADSLGFTQTTLVSDVPGLAANTDPNLKNPWGVSFAPASPFWISNRAPITATLYDGAGDLAPLVVVIPPSAYWSSLQWDLQFQPARRQPCRVPLRYSGRANSRLEWRCWHHGGKCLNHRWSGLQRACNRQQRWSELYLCGR